MRIAIIDLGTNSVRFDVHQLGAGRARMLHREKIMVRLGQGVFMSGELNPDAIRRTVHAFHSFKKIAAELRVSKMIALGTSALREAADSAKLVSRVKSSTGIEVKVISGVEEARLIALGVLANENVRKGKTALIDIGGGSTEIIIAQGKRILNAESFQLGTARLQQVFLKKSPPSPENVDQLRVYIRSSIAKIVEERWPKPAHMIGSSGTVRALHKVLKKATGKKAIKLKDLSALIQRMRKMSTTQLLEIPGMESKRVDMILAGAILLEECMLALDVSGLDCTDYSLRDGILEEQRELAKKHSTSQIGLHLNDLIDKAVRFGGNKAQFAELVENAEMLFKGLSRLHKLGPDWRFYLEAAAILRNLGEAVSIVDNPAHSYYIIKNSKFPFIEEWESEFVAQLCLHHEEHKLEMKKVPFAKQRSRQHAYLKLLAMLWIIDALDSGARAPAQIKRVSVHPGKVRIAFANGTRTDLEIFRLEQRKALFRKVFGRELIAVRV